jgi:NTE family protein
VVESRVSLALGGGAAKGLAHVGVLRGLEEDGIGVAAIAGTSMGSIVGALFSRGMAAREMEAFFSAVDWSRLGRIMVRSPGGTAFSDLLRETIGEASIEELELPFAAVCCDLDDGEEVVLGTGDLADAVRASSAIPGILPPLVVDGRTLVDGALVTPVPVAAAGRLADGPVLAVNVLRPPKPGQLGKRMMNRLFEGSAPVQLLERVDTILKNQGVRLRNRNAEFPSRFEVMMQSFHIMQYNLSKLCASDLHAVEPEVGEVGWFDFHRAREIMAEGYRAYRESTIRV